MQRASIATLAGIAMFLATVVPLHFLQPDFQPADQLMSELALGRYGWTMIFAFSGLAISMFGVQAAIGSFGASLGLRALLIAASLCFVGAGIFPLGDRSEIHIAAIASAFVLSVLAMYFYPSGSGRASAAAPRALSWGLAGAIAASVALGHSVLPMGVGQRLAAACLLAWLAVLAWRLRR